MRATLIITLVACIAIARAVPVSRSELRNLEKINIEGKSEIAESKKNSAEKEEYSVDEVVSVLKNDEEKEEEPFEVNPEHSAKVSRKADEVPDIEDDKSEDKSHEALPKHGDVDTSISHDEDSSSFEDDSSDESSNDSKEGSAVKN